MRSLEFNKLLFEDKNTILSLHDSKIKSMRLILIVFVLALLMGCFNPVQNPIESLSLEEIHDQISLSETKRIPLEW